MYQCRNQSLLGKLFLFHLIGDTAASANSFWDCLILSDECMFFSGSDPYLIYFGFGIIGFYSLIVTMFLADLKFWWKIDNFHVQIDQLIVKVKHKMKKVLERRKQPSVQELARRELSRCQDSQRVAAALRYMVANDLPLQVPPLPSQYPSLNRWRETALCDLPSKSPKSIADDCVQSDGRL